MAEVVKVCTGNFGKGAQDIEVYKKLGGYANISDRLFNMSQWVPRTLKSTRSWAATQTFRIACST